jgi:uncharacterized protein
MLRALVLGLLLPFAAFAQGLPAPLGDTVSDYADVLTPQDEARISDLITRTRDETGVHIVVATMDRIANYGAGDLGIIGYAKALFNQWGIGDAARNDGILMLVATDDRVVRIALGAAYDAVYDGRAQRVIDTALLPQLRAGRIADGILAGVQSTRDRVITPFLAGKPITVDEGFATDPNATPVSPFVWLGGIGVVGVGLFRGWSGWRERKRCPKCKALTLTRSYDVVSPATSLSDGNGIQHLSCPSCGFTERRPYTISRQNDRSNSNGRGGSSGGFGGGRSSGGGATGRW